MDRKLIKGILSLLLIAASLCFNVFADTAYVTGTRVSAIPSVRLRIDLSDVIVGSDFSVDPLNCVSAAENVYYDIAGADWVDPPAVIKIGDTPRMKVYLSAFPKEIPHDNYVQLWLFSGGYGAGNISVQKGTLEQATVRDSGYSLEVTITTEPVKGTYSAPASVTWTGNTGMGIWTPNENSSPVYDVICRRDGTTVKKLTRYQGESYNFYPYMTRPGGYTIEVRSAVPQGSSSGIYASEYVTSAYQWLDPSQVSDGTGQTTEDEVDGSASHATGNTNYPNGSGNAKVAGWVTDITGTYFRYPGGAYAKNTWLQLNGIYYRLDEKGRRLTGWFQSPDSGLWYYLDPSTGAMKTGWLYDGTYWYYLRPDKDGTEGRMTTGWCGINGRLYYFNQSGIMVTGWYQIGDKWYYFYPQGSLADGSYGYMAKNTRIGEFTIGPEGYWIY